MYYPYPLLDADPILSAAHETPVSLPGLKEAHERALVERAHCGDRAARDAILLNLMPSVQRFAFRYYAAHAWEMTSALLSGEDLTHDACVVMLEQSERVITQAERPFAHLLTTAYGAIRASYHTQSSVMKTPRRAGAHLMQVESLDAPLSADGEETLLDTLPGKEGITPSHESEERDDTLLYQAIASLPSSQRAALVRCYGLALDTTPEQGPVQIASNDKLRALSRLYRLLAPVYPHYVGGDMYLQERAAAPPVRLNESQARRLAQAQADLQAQGQPLTARKLSRAAGVDVGHASSYLREQGLVPLPRKERLAQARAQLEASGEPLTAKALARVAHVSDAGAMLYVQQQGLVPPPCEERLAQARAQLEASGRPIRVEALMRAAHVTREQVKRYLHEACAAGAFTCLRCGAPVRMTRAGLVPQFCSQACQKAIYRRAACDGVTDSPERQVTV